MSKLPSPKQVRDSLILASTDDLMAELVARADVALIILSGIPDRNMPAVIGYKGTPALCKKIAVNAAQNMAEIMREG